MKIGPITIRRTKAVEAEQAKREHRNQARNKVVALLLKENNYYKAEFQRWGIKEGMIDQRTG